MGRVTKITGSTVYQQLQQMSNQNIVNNKQSSRYRSVDSVKTKESPKLFFQIVCRTCPNTGPRREGGRLVGVYRRRDRRVCSRRGGAPPDVDRPEPPSPALPCLCVVLRLCVSCVFLCLYVLVCLSVSSVPSASAVSLRLFSCRLSPDYPTACACVDVRIRVYLSI